MDRDPSNNRNAIEEVFFGSRNRSGDGQQQRSSSSGQPSSSSSGLPSSSSSGQPGSSYYDWIVAEEVRYDSEEHERIREQNRKEKEERLHKHWEEQEAERISRQKKEEEKRLKAQVRAGEMEENEARAILLKRQQGEEKYKRTQYTDKRKYTSIKKSPFTPEEKKQHLDKEEAIKFLKIQKEKELLKEKSDNEKKITDIIQNTSDQQKSRIERNVTHLKFKEASEKFNQLPKKDKIKLGDLLGIDGNALSYEEFISKVLQMDDDTKKVIEDLIISNSRTSTKTPVQFSHENIHNSNTSRDENIDQYKASDDDHDIDLHVLVSGASGGINNPPEKSYSYDDIYKSLSKIDKKEDLLNLASDLGVTIRKSSKKNRDEVRREIISHVNENKDDSALDVIKTYANKDGIKTHANKDGTDELFNELEPKLKDYLQSMKSRQELKNFAAAHGIDLPENKQDRPSYIKKMVENVKNSNDEHLLDDLYKDLGLSKTVIPKLIRPKDNVSSEEPFILNVKDNSLDDETKSTDATNTTSRNTRRSSTTPFSPSNFRSRKSSSRASSLDSSHKSQQARYDNTDTEAQNKETEVEDFEHLGGQNKIMEDDEKNKQKENSKEPSSTPSLPSDFHSRTSSNSSSTSKSRISVGDDNTGKVRFSTNPLHHNQRKYTASP